MTRTEAIARATVIMQAMMLNHPESINSLTDYKYSIHYNCIVNKEKENLNEIMNEIRRLTGKTAVPELIKRKESGNDSIDITWRNFEK